jgi:ubiquinone/menaquinone biosynthesis C-methylase UbiE
MSSGTSTRSWALDGPVTSPFARPRGLAGRLAGRFMLLTNKQQDVVELLDVRPGSSVLEVGYGPGGLVRLLRERTPATRICGVDPSREMRAMARRRNREAADRVDLRVGSVDCTGFPDQSFDRVITVNTVAIWPDLDAGLSEIHRVTRPHGRVVIAWHSATAPSPIARSLALPQDKLVRIERGLGELFSQVSRHDLTAVTAFAADR